MMITADQLVADYLTRLRAATADLPDGEREELVSAIAEHIATASAELGEPTEADIRTLLDRLGEPGAIAAEARGQSADPPTRFAVAGPDLGDRPPPGPQRRPGGLEWGGVAVLGLGSYLLPVVGTVVGLVMICRSPWWTPRQKVVAAILSLSGAILIPLIGLIALSGLALVDAPVNGVTPPTPR